jgi:phage tail sheath protein FI
MPEYLSPAVYVEEVSSGSKPIESVGTSTGAFVGLAERGPIDKAELITSWTQYQEIFGGIIADGLLPWAVFHFFNEGGTKCWVVRTCTHTENIPDARKADPITLYDSDGNPSMLVEPKTPGTWAKKYRVYISNGTNNLPNDPQKLKFKLSVQKEITRNNVPIWVDVEVFDNLEMDSVEDRVNKESIYIKIEVDGWNDGTVVGSGKRPKNSGPDSVAVFANGDDGNSRVLQVSDLIGDESSRTGLHAFDVVDDINIVAIPDGEGRIEIMSAGMTYCENRGDCFFIADSMEEQTPTQILETKLLNYSSSFGALYYPWISVNDQLDPRGGTRLIPPSGSIAGIISRTDVARGVHKAPAGISEGRVRGARDLEKVLSKGEHDLLNNPGINVIRQFPGAGIVVWGARTVAVDAEWKYINVRRLFLMVEESIYKGTQWVVFEPNDPTLWAKVKRNITAFLTNVWRDGALFGSTPDEAFFVKVDAENNPPSVRDAGRLIIEVGIAPVKPAEFVIIRIQQKVLEA